MPQGDEELPEEERVDRLESIDKTLKELLMWTRFANIPKLKEILEKELDTDSKKVAYESSDGTNALSAISEISGTPVPTLGKWWPKWFRLGLVTESETRKGRMKKIVSLEDVGIEVPKKKASSATAGKPPAEEPVDQPTKDLQQAGGNT